MSDDVTRLAEVLAAHLWHHTATTHCACGFRAPLAQLALIGYINHVAEVIAPLIAEARLLGATQAKSDAIDAHAELVARMEGLADEWEAEAAGHEGHQPVSAYGQGECDTERRSAETHAAQVRAALNDPTEETP